MWAAIPLVSLGCGPGRREQARAALSVVLSPTAAAHGLAVTLARVLYWPVTGSIGGPMVGALGIGFRGAEPNRIVVMGDCAKARRRRARQRAARMTRGADVPLPETGLARIELAFELSKVAWTMTGRPWPSIPRGQLPIRRVQASRRG